MHEKWRSVELKQSIIDLLSFVFSFAVAKLSCEFIFDIENLWIIFGLTAVISVIFNRLAEKIEYKLLDIKNKNNK